MKILTAAQLKQIDKQTIESERIASIDLMERAAKSCVNWLSNHYTVEERIAVICGKGNNGGDGLAIARQLLELGYNVDIYVLNHSTKSSSDFDTNVGRLTTIHEVNTNESAIDFNVYTLLVDCILGSGFNRPNEGLVCDVIEQINTSSAKVIAIDMPSGFYADIHDTNMGARIKCNICLTLELPKLALLLPENQKYVSQMVVVPIGLHQLAIDEQPTDYYYIDRQMASALYLPRDKFAHKGNFGHAMMVAGSFGKMGAALLASKACLRAGSGLVTACIPQSGNVILQTGLPEAMVIADVEQNFLTNPIDTEDFTVGIGPGIGLHPNTAEFLQVVLKASSKPMVIDADALNILSENKSWIRLIHRNSILTPHPKELERLIGEWKDDYDKLARVKLFCKNNNVYVVIKGAHTAIVGPDNNTYFNSTGNPGMATAGSGDVLTGIITGLLAQGYTSLNAALLGVYLHGCAGDLAAEALSQDALIASDIINHMGAAFKELQKQ